MSIALNAADYEAIRTHGEETFPEECCGFMLRRGEWRRSHGVGIAPGGATTGKTRRGTTASSSRPEEFMKSEKTARSKGLDVVGFYHSHPNAPARPSQYDLDHAWPFYSYVIVSIQDGSADAMTSWRLAEGRNEFTEEPIVTGG